MISKGEMIDKTGIKPSLNEEEIREYLQEVMNQIRPKITENDDYRRYR
jgi:polyhydroxyalkanoate synthesis regulator phasin